MVIGQGRILSDGSLADLRRQVGDERVLRVDLRQPQAELGELPARLVSRQGGRCVLRFDPEAIPAPELIRQITMRHEVEDLFLESAPIEEIVAALYAKHRLEGEK